MIAPVKACKPLQLIQSPCALERLRIQLQRRMGRVRSGASARRLLGRHGVRGGIGAQEEFVRAGVGGFQQGLSMGLALVDGEAVEVGLDPADQ